MRKMIIGGAVTILSLISASCGVTVQHKVAPIFITVDVNINIQKELEKFFEFEKNRGKSVDAGSKDKSIAQ